MNNQSADAREQRAKTAIAPGQRDSHVPAPLNEKAFLKALCLERRRAERSRKPLLLVLVREKNADGHKSKRLVQAVFHAERTVASRMRETDTRGWYGEFSIYGFIFTEFNDSPRVVVQNRISQRIREALEYSLPSEQLNDLEFSFHFYPEDEGGLNSSSLPDKNLYADLTSSSNGAKISRSMKRALDVIGSVAGIVLLSPVLVAIAVLVKLNSRGPVLFKQARVGQYGARFTFLKFRSMEIGSDPRIHEDFVKGYIRGHEGAKQITHRGDGAYKLTQDPRVTKIGRFLRKTSLDELPQLFNVLKGEMSLVGPRPPIPYELEAYDVWHMRRLLEARPGITGLWQVVGRSRTTFDEMVRLDLRYARSWSFWLDIKILLRTPRAVVSGDGAY